MSAREDGIETNTATRVTQAPGEQPRTNGLGNVDDYYRQQTPGNELPAGQQPPAAQQTTPNGFKRIDDEQPAEQSAESGAARVIPAVEQQPAGEAEAPQIVPAVEKSEEPPAEQTPELDA